jgi:hypothetical protein
LQQNLVIVQHQNLVIVQQQNLVIVQLYLLSKSIKPILFQKITQFSRLFYFIQIIKSICAITSDKEFESLIGEVNFKVKYL